MVAHDEARLYIQPTVQQGSGAEVAIGDLQLAGLGITQQRRSPHVFALVRVLAEQDICGKGAVESEDQLGVTWHGRTEMRSQRKQIARVLGLATRSEYLVYPVHGQSPLQGHACRPPHGRLTREALQYFFSHPQAFPCMRRAYCLRLVKP